MFQKSHTTSKTRTAYDRAYRAMRQSEKLSQIQDDAEQMRAYNRIHSMFRALKANHPVAFNNASESLDAREWGWMTDKCRGF